MKKFQPPEKMLWSAIWGAIQEGRGWIFISMKDRVLHNEDGTDEKTMDINMYTAGRELNLEDEEKVKQTLLTMLGLAILTVDPREETE